MRNWSSQDRNKAASASAKLIGAAFFAAHQTLGGFNCAYFVYCSFCANNNHSKAIRTMRRIVILVTITVLMLGLTCVTSSAYFKYTTADGTTCFAESLELVPSRYRSKAVEISYARDRRRTMPEHPDRATYSPEPGRREAEDIPATAGKGFRWNLGWLGLLGVLGFLFAKRIERRGFFGHAFNIRRMILLALAVLACFFNWDIVSGCMEAIRLKVASIRKSIALQREKDKKPLKPLSERVEEVIHRSNN